MTEDLSRDYANAAFIAGAETFPPRWAAEGEALRASLGERALLGLSYGPGARQVYDLFLPQGTPHGLLVFIHGGYWLAFGPRDWSGFASGALACGWAVAMLGYTLAPEARITQMVDEIRRGLLSMMARVAGPVVVTGHSAGGHLSARMGCADIDLPDRVRRVVPVSPLSDLRPLMRTDMNARLGIDTDEALAQSPVAYRLRPGTEAVVWVGAQERPAFLWQARLLSEHWDCPWHAAPGRHHFDVIDALRDPDSDLMQVLLNGL
jgi:arylformamidase